MLNTMEHLQKPMRNPRRERRLWHNEETNTLSLGCHGCRNRDLCGGLRAQSGLFDCLQNCCGKPEGCDKVCRNNSDYVARVREVGGFTFDNVPRAEPLPDIALPRMVPLIFHASRRSGVIHWPVVALPLYEMFDRRSGEPRFADRASLCKTYGVPLEATIVLTGTAHDAPLERWWGVGEEKRRKIIRHLVALGVALTTTPNFSVFSNRPRWDDLHSMKRIALTHREFLSEGLAAALHVNGRTDRDFERWAEYIQARPEVTDVAYEFTTGTGQGKRREHHARWLVDLARATNRPLRLVVRGGTDVLPVLADAFAHVTALDTSAFMKTMKRQKAITGDDARMIWESTPTDPGESLHDLLAANVSVMHDRLSALAAPPTKPDAAAA
jgi:hypothetical protein